MIPDTRDQGKIYDGLLLLKKAGSKKPLWQIKLNLNFKGKAKQKIKSLIMASNVIGMKFDSFGTHILELMVKSRKIASTKINVVKKKNS